MGSRRHRVSKVSIRGCRLGERVSKLGERDSKLQGAWFVSPGWIPIWDSLVPMTLRSLLGLVCAVVSCGSSGPPDPVPTPGAMAVEACGLTSACACSSGGNCDVACAGQTSCNTDCSGGSMCGVVDCRGDTACTVACSGGSKCDYVDCKGDTSCNVDCSGGGRCNVNCEDVTGCDVTCSGGSPCLMYCGGTTSCTFGECSGGSGTSLCPGNIAVCNRPCPACGDGVCDTVASETCSSCPKDCGPC